MQVKSEYGSAVEFEIDASRDHWSELAALSTDDDEDDETAETDEQVWARWKQQWPGGFFFEWGEEMEMEVGEKIAEGGQAEIFTARRVIYDGTAVQDSVLKVFKGYALRDLENLWPVGMLQNRINGGAYHTPHSCMIWGATLLLNGRFAFHMHKYWGDLRKLIDFRMQHNGNQSPPFGEFELGRILVTIARGMEELHEHGIVHRDLKASNVLIHLADVLNDSFDPIKGEIECSIADYECSVGVVGTGYWRAPEILKALQQHDIKPHLFTQKVDVYSYAMTCYEVLTGLIPFENLNGNCYNVVIGGQRPNLPQHIDPALKTLLSKCWHENPLERPSFDKIIGCMKKIYPFL